MRRALRAERHDDRWQTVDVLVVQHGRLQG